MLLLRKSSRCSFGNVFSPSIVALRLSSVSVVRLADDRILVTVGGIGETDTLTGIEEISFSDTVIPASSLPVFNPLHYLASNPYLLQAFGAEPQRATSHYAGSGFFEGRSASAFDALRYIASNFDLRLAFGVNEAAAI